MDHTTHSFSVELATKIGLSEAIILQHFHFWHQHNKESEAMNKDGMTWFFLSRRGIAKVFPYLSEQTIRTSIQHLEAEELIRKGDYHNHSYNRTCWYALTEKALEFFGEDTDTPLVDLTNALVEVTTPLVDLTTPLVGTNQSIDSNKDNKKDNKSRGRSSKFVIPALEEVTDFIKEINALVDPEEFYNYYQSNGWKVGRNPMKDWRAAVKQWSAKRKKEQSATSKPADTKPKSFFERYK